MEGNDPPPTDFTSQMVLLFSKLANPDTINSLMGVNEQRLNLVGVDMEVHASNTHNNRIQRTNLAVNTSKTLASKPSDHEDQDTVVGLSHITDGNLPPMRNHNSAPNVAASPLGGATDISSNFIPLYSSISSHTLLSTSHVINVQNRMVSHDHNLQDYQENKNL